MPLFKIINFKLTLNTTTTLKEKKKKIGKKLNEKFWKILISVYQCVNVCKSGYFRPENEIICRLLPEGTT